MSDQRFYQRDFPKEVQSHLKKNTMNNQMSIGKGPGCQCERLEIEVSFYITMTCKHIKGMDMVIHDQMGTEASRELYIIQFYL